MIEKQHEPKLTLWSHLEFCCISSTETLKSHSTRKVKTHVCRTRSQMLKSLGCLCVCRENQHMCWGVESAEPFFFGFRLGEPSDDPLPWGWERASRWCPSCPALKVTSRQGNWFHIKVGMVRMLQPTLRDRWAMNKWRKLLREDMNDIYLIISRFPTCLSLCGC
jgi:hypothetical protein